jgi:hypothetical protein
MITAETAESDQVASRVRNYVIGGVVLLVILLLISEHSKQNTIGSSATGAGAVCTMTVIADSPVRSDAEGNAPVVGALNRGAAVLAERTVSNGYRKLGLSIWAPQGSLRPAPGNDCS